MDGSFQSFFSLLRLAKTGQYDLKACKLPKYLPTEGFTTLVVGFVRLNETEFIILYSRDYKKTHKVIKVKIPPVLKGKRIKEIRILPKLNARFFEIQYIYEEECTQRKLKKTQSLALDFGVTNLVTGVTNKGDTFIIDGKKLKKY